MRSGPLLLSDISIRVQSLETSVLAAVYADRAVLT